MSFSSQSFPFPRVIVPRHRRYPIQLLTTCPKSSSLLAKQRITGLFVRLPEKAQAYSESKRQSDPTENIKPEQSKADDKRQSIANQSGIIRVHPYNPLVRFRTQHEENMDEVLRGKGKEDT